MNIVAMGLNHRTAPVEVRERLSVSEAELPTALAQLRQTRTVLESVLISTCNRTEVYAVVSSPRAGEDYLRTWFARRAGISPDALVSYTYFYEGPRAAQHLMRVAAGLDSMILGETQILGQVRDAFLAAVDTGNTGALLNRLFNLAVRVGKRAQTATEIGKSAVSVSYAAVQLAKKVFENLKAHRVLVVGAGKTGRLAAQHLRAQGAAELAVINRTLERAEVLAAELGAKALAWDELPGALVEADIVVTATGSPDVVISAEMVRAAARRRGGRPQLLIDIAVPRDIDPRAAEETNVYLYDIDDLEGVVAANLAERARAAESVERMIDEALHEFGRWLAEQEVVPLITAVREKGLRIQAAVMESLERKLPDLTERERKLIHKHTMSIVNQLLRDPIQNMKELAITSGGSRQIGLFAQLFGISEEELRAAAPVWLEEAEETEGGWMELLRQWGHRRASDDGTASMDAAQWRAALR